MARRAYTDDEKAEALKLYEEHGPSAVQKRLGIPKGTVGRWAKAAQIGTVRSENVRARVEAAQLDNAERRALLVKRLYGLAETSMDLLEQPDEYKTILRGEFGVERADSPGFIPAQDKQRELTAIGIALDKAAVLEKFDHDGGATEAKGLLSALRDKIGMRHER